MGDPLCVLENLRIDELARGIERTGQVSRERMSRRRSS